VWRGGQPTETLRQGSRVPGLALPDDLDAPAQVDELLRHPAIPGDVGRELGLPELGSRLGVGAATTSFVPVPEAAMNEHRHLMFRKYEIRPARQIGAMQPKPQAASMGQTPHCQFRTSVLPPDAPHQSASVLGRKRVGQGKSFEKAKIT
jgi:hypothetical protein